jgi:CrcB protein
LPVTSSLAELISDGEKSRQVIVIVACAATQWTFVLRREIIAVLAYLWVALGSALGGMARYAVSGMVAMRVGETFPWGTLVVNVSGCLLIGIFAAMSLPGGAFPGSPTVRQLLMIGICGGYTTFSSFSLQTLALARGRESARAAFYVVASVGLCLAAVAAGFVATAAISGG